MNAKEKAKDLVDKFSPYSRDWNVEKYALYNAKINALICVDEISNEQGMVYHTDGTLDYWQEVKLEIQKL